MNASHLVQAIASFINEEDHVPWKERAKQLREAAEEADCHSELGELLSWFDGDIDTEL